MQNKLNKLSKKQLISIIKNQNIHETNLTSDLHLAINANEMTSVTMTDVINEHNEMSESLENVKEAYRALAERHNIALKFIGSLASSIDVEY